MTLFTLTDGVFAVFSFPDSNVDFNEQIQSFTNYEKDKVCVSYVSFVSFIHSF